MLDAEVASPLDDPLDFTSSAFLIWSISTFVNVTEPVCNESISSPLI